jgi:pimeloyl-ACP methyl ester carboxylesterase
LRSALNGAFGDHLAASNNLLAIRMAIPRADGVLRSRSTPLRCAATFAEAGKRLCVFIHGLSCDERCWEGDDRDAQRRRSISAAGCKLSSRARPSICATTAACRSPTMVRNWPALLEELLANWPQPASELLLIGHSMGGLLALAACEHAAAADLRWPHATRMLICLGSPNLGSSVERLGQLTNAALNLSRITAPLGKIAGHAQSGGEGSPTRPWRPAQRPGPRPYCLPLSRRQPGRRRGNPGGELSGDFFGTPSASSSATDWSRSAARPRT